MMENKAATEKIAWEYRVQDTPKFTEVEDGWELVDVIPKLRNHLPIYLLVFRRRLFPPKLQLEGEQVKGERE